VARLVRRFSSGAPLARQWSLCPQLTVAAAPIHNTDQATCSQIRGWSSLYHWPLETKWLICSILTASLGKISIHHVPSLTAVLLCFTLPDFPLLTRALIESKIAISYLYILIRTMLPCRSSILLSFSFLTSLIPSAYCWGSLGHRTVAYLASEYFTANASSYVSSLLNSQDISEAALFADKVRHMPGFGYSAPWHYIDAADDPPRQCGINMKRDCVIKTGCVVSAIVNQTARILNHTTSHADRGQALRFLLHFIGDIHQPLHTEAEGRGGNEIMVLFGKKHTNLHAIWDTDILIKHAGAGEDEKADALVWAKKLYAADKNKAASLAAECHDLQNALNCTFDWAEEANQFICDYVLKDDVPGVENKDLSKDYYNGAVPIVDALIGKAGRRLGAWVNALAVNTPALSNIGSGGASSSENILLVQEEL
jgi:S1/P1 Nuclease